jgi:hypothetical protein
MNFSPTELPIYVHLRNLLDAFQQRAIKYCAAAETPGEAFSRVIEMRNALTGIGEIPDDVNLACPPCPAGEHCEGGACVQDIADSGIDSCSSCSLE